MIMIHWQDNHVSEYDPEWLSKTEYPGERGAVELPAEEVTNQEEGV